ncbi:Vacuolar protein sorting-associated protein 26 [Rhizoctonia solani]|uniref:Vacuolar protein sorting-associated protein 26 n=1 Tax=Rhizoctonia solani TaxID=456999 RepID=A0A8H7H892_9AGAM|nr:Vacuolar protein sorting-associated protein 26 [Rhizoctonia solani]
MAFLFAQPVDIDIKLENEEARKLVDTKIDKERTQSCPVYYDGESVVGQVTVRVRDGRKLVHDGIKVEFVGCIELFYDRGNHHEFLSLSQELAAPGEMRQAQTFDFSFKNVEKQYESYQGINVKLRYFVRVTLSRRMADVTKERDVWVHSYRMPPDSNNSIKMEVGIEDCLHIEFEYNKSKYHLKDVIVGKIYFLLVRIKIKHMELSIIRRETTGAAPNQYNESETITKFEIMDGAPVRGETIPIRLFLGGFELTPTFRDVNKKFSTRYYLNLVLIDEENRRYFKQQEITVFRIPEVSMVLIPKSRPALIPSTNLELTHGLVTILPNKFRFANPTTTLLRGIGLTIALYLGRLHNNTTNLPNVRPQLGQIYIASGFRNPPAIKPRIRLEQTPQPSHFFSSARSTRIQSQAHYRTLTTMSTIPGDNSADYKPKGTFETINGISTYVIGDKSSKKAIVVVMDVFGMVPLTQQGCDILASQGFYVLMPDYLGDQALGDGDIPFNTPEKIEKRNKLFSGVGNPQTRAVDLVKLGEKLKSEGFTVGSIGYCWGGKLIMIAGASDAFAAVAGFVRFRLLAPEDAANCKAAIGLYPTKDEDPTAMEPFVKIAKDYKLYSSVHHGFAAARARLDDPHHKAEYEDVFRRLSAFFKKYLASAKL